MQLLPVSWTTIPVSLFLLSYEHLHLLQCRRRLKQMCRNICTMRALLCHILSGLLWAVELFCVRIRSSKGRECSGNCRSPFEVSVHEMIYTRSRCVSGGCRLCRRLGAEKKCGRLHLGGRRRKEHRPGNDFG